MIKLTKTILSAVLFFNITINANAASTVNENDNTVEQNTNNTDPDPEQVKIINNANVGIFPGGGGVTKQFVPKGLISPEISKDFIVTGIEAAEHGKEIVIYATQGSIVLAPNNTDSSPNNRIAYSYGNMTINQGQVAELTYNANTGKWIVTNIE